MPKKLCVDRNTCHNMLCHSECEENWIFAVACDNKRIIKKQVKNIMAFNDEEKGLVLK